MSKKLKSLFAIGKPKNNNSGFTIVEVMIVLAVAGLILAVVFIAVPALQRNQRNSARRNDLAYIKASFDTMLANNGGRLPTTPHTSLAGALNINELNQFGGAQLATPALQTSGTALGNGATATADTIYVLTAAPSTSGGGNKIAENTLVGYTKHRCKVGVLAGASGAVAAWEGTSGNDLIEPATARTSTAWIYKLEGDANTYCSDDSN